MVAGVGDGESPVGEVGAAGAVPGVQGGLEFVPQSPAAGLAHGSGQLAGLLVRGVGEVDAGPATGGGMKPPVGVHRPCPVGSGMGVDELAAVGEQTGEERGQGELPVELRMGDDGGGHVGAGHCGVSCRCRVGGVRAGATGGVQDVGDRATGGVVLAVGAQGHEPGAAEKPPGHRPGTGGIGVAGQDDAFGDIGEDRSGGGELADSVEATVGAQDGRQVPAGQCGRCLPC